MREVLEQCEVAHVVQLEPPRWLGQACFTVAKHIQRTVCQQVEKRWAERACVFVPDEQLAEFTDGDLLQRIHRLQGGTVIGDHFLHELALGPGCRIGQVACGVGTVEDPPAIVLVVGPIRFCENGMEQV